MTTCGAATIHQWHISTHTSLAGRDDLEEKYAKLDSISTHTSLAGRDILFLLLVTAGKGFLLTRPSRDVTTWYSNSHILHIISTHTSLAGRDGNGVKDAAGYQNFYSHVPRGT